MTSYRRALTPSLALFLFIANGAYANRDGAQQSHVLVGANARSSPAAAKTGSAQTKKTPAPPAEPDLEPSAIELLQATSDRLAAAQTMSFTAVEMFEQPSRDGHPLVYATRSDVTLRRPDGLRVLISGDGPKSEFYYDRNLMMAFAPAQNLLAIGDAPDTIDATLEAAYHAAGIYFPFSDFIVSDPYKDMAEGLKLAYYIGQSEVIGGVTTDIVAYIDNNVFLELWIGAGDKLPRMVHAFFLNDPEHLRHQLEFSNWQVGIGVPADAFAPAKAARAKRIEFAHPHPQPAPSAKSPAGFRSKTSQP
jgi:hypothetical protein